MNKHSCFWITLVTIDICSIWEAYVRQGGQHLVPAETGQAMFLATFGSLFIFLMLFDLREILLYCYAKSLIMYPAAMNSFVIKVVSSDIFW